MNRESPAGGRVWVIIGVIAVALVTLGAIRNVWPALVDSSSGLIDKLRPKTEEDIRGTILVEGWDEAVDTFLMDVPDLCPSQRLDYSAWQKDLEQPAWVEFVVSQMEEPVHTTGRTDVAEFVQDSQRWSLDDDSVYALTVRGIHARWRFAVVCD